MPMGVGGGGDTGSGASLVGLSASEAEVGRKISSSATCGSRGGGSVLGATRYSKCVCKTFF